MKIHKNIILKHNNALTAYKNELKGIIGARDYVWSSLRSTFESYPDGVNKYITELDFDECYTTNWRNWMKRECKTFDRLMLKKDTNSYIGHNTRYFLAIVVGVLLIII